MTRVAGVVLAGGHGDRIGGEAPKPLLALAGTPLVVRALDAISDTDLSPIVLVVGRHGNDVQAVATPGVMVVHAPRWHEGIAHSLHAGLDAIDGYAQVSAVCVGLADQPLVGAESYRRLVAAHEAGATLAVATYGGQRANPVLLGRDLWEEVRALTGDVGARALFDRHDAVEVDCTDTGSPDDVDTIDDLHRLEARLAGDAT